MIDLGDVAAGLLGMGLIVGTGVGLVAVGGRDRTADQHDVSDYRPDVDATEERAWHRGFDTARRYPAPARRDWPLINVDRPTSRRWLNPGSRLVGGLPRIPTEWAIGTPMYAAIVVDQVARRYGTDPADRAARFLAEIAAEQRGDVIWNARGGVA